MVMEEDGKLKDLGSFDGNGLGVPSVGGLRRKVQAAVEVSFVSTGPAGRGREAEARLQQARKLQGGASKRGTVGEGKWGICTYQGLAISSYASTPVKDRVNELAPIARARD